MQRVFLTRTAAHVRTRYSYFSKRGNDCASYSPLLSRRHNHISYERKYAEKLQERAKVEGISLEELKRKVKEAATAKEEKPSFPTKASNAGEDDSLRRLPAAVQKERTDSSPVKPLSSILNTSRIFATPHTPEQISALWTAYHMSRSGGTGRGFVCASIPLAMYQKMAGTASKYPNFVVPVPRPRTTTEAEQSSENDTAYEFYYLQWDFHDKPPTPTATDDPFTVPKSSANPPISTVLFTPLQEYRARMSFATPYLVLTHYTDFAETHGIVLLRGEITPSSNSAGLGADIKYMLTQNDVQLLSMTIQQFYLWDTNNERDNERGLLLKKFHEEPQQFRWEDLLKQGI